MIITEINRNPQKVPEGTPLTFRIGEPLHEGGFTVEKIIYHPGTRLFNKGLEVGQGCYAVYFEGIDERRLIMEDTVVDIEAVKEQKKEKIPELPE